jgi:carbon-monoxide dehydrogenase large subunit
VTSRARVEDFCFLTGRGRNLDALDLFGGCHLALARVPVAHAPIRAVDISAAEAAPGVQLVLTADSPSGTGASYVPLELPSPGTSAGD